VRCAGVIGDRRVRAGDQENAADRVGVDTNRDIEQSIRSPIRAQYGQYHIGPLKRKEENVHQADTAQWIPGLKSFAIVSDTPVVVVIAAPGLGKMCLYSPSAANEVVDYSAGRISCWSNMKEPLGEIAICACSWHPTIPFLNPAPFRRADG
jgi:hypothetical protein